MAKVTIAGQAVVITSALALEDIKRVKKYRPNALTLRGGEDGKEPIFSLGVGRNEINQYGASFSNESRDESKLATITLMTDYTGEDITEYVADKFGSALINLGKLEEKLPAVIEEINAERDAIMSGIEIAQ